MNSTFDNTKPNVILISDHTSQNYMMKTFGPFKIARELRLAGYEVAVIHHAHIFTYEEIAKILTTLISDKTLFVGVNNMFYQSMEFSEDPSEKAGVRTYLADAGSILPHGKYPHNSNLISLIKSLNSNCKLVLGGPTADVLPINSDFDYVVVGYADLSVVNLANHLLNGEPLKKAYKSLYKFTVINDAKAEGFDFTNSKMEYLPYDCILPGETLLLEVSRGCIFNCAFCSFPLNGKKKLDYIKNPDNLLEELNTNYEKYNITRYIFLDDTFNDSVEKVQMMYNISKQLPFQLEFWAYIRLDLLAAHPETIDLLVEAGLRGCQFGIETLNKPSAKAIGKGQNREKQLEALRYIKSKWGSKIMLHGSFIAGLPYESKESMKETYELFLTDDTLLDSLEIHPMGIEICENSAKEFRSLISRNPEKYGYTVPPIDPTKSMFYRPWKNEHTNTAEVIALAEEYSIRAAKFKNKVIPQEAMFLAGIGFTMDDFANTLNVDFDWHKANAMKQKRAQEYKDMFFKAFSIKL